MKDRYIVAVANASAGAGASFICGLIAAQNGKKEKLSVVELSSSYFYEALGIEKHFVFRQFVSYKNLMESGKSVRNLNNTLEDVNWALLVPGETPPGYAEIFRVINNMPGETIVLDCSEMEEEMLFNVLSECDEILFVIDPLPTKLLKSFRHIEQLRLKFPKARLVVNKMNDGVRRGELKRFLSSHNLTEIPYFDPSLVYKAEYNCVLPAKFIDMTKVPELIRR